VVVIEATCCLRRSRDGSDACCCSRGHWLLRGSCLGERQRLIEASSAAASYFALVLKNPEAGSQGLSSANYFITPSLELIFELINLQE
jgi:hypothetical protein